MIYQIRSDAVNALATLTDNCILALVTEEFKQDYQVFLEQNHLPKTTILCIIDECNCEGNNRCDRCQRILEILAGNNPGKKLDSVLKYKAILTQIRKLG
jgi:hypothetical protein